LKRKLSLLERFALFVVLPTLLVVFYYALWASDMYVSEAGFTIRSSESEASFDPLSLFGKSSGSTTIDAYVVEDFIQSVGLLKVLDERLALREHYQADTADFFSRLESNASIEDFHDYFLKIVQVTFDPVTSIISLRTRAYNPEMAQKLCQGILEQSELLINQLREQALKNSLALAHSELATAEKSVSEIRSALKVFRNKSDLLNPEASAGSALSLITELEGAAIKARTQMAEVRSYMRADSTQVTTLKARIAALEKQIKAEKARLTGSDGHALNDMLADYEKIMVEREFAEQRYIAALSTLEAARIRAEEKSRYLVAFSPATLPEESIWPRRISFSGMAFAGTTLLFGIASLIIAAIREHTGF
jgi:capsular polysaccharide transport system permease protein